MTEPNEHRSGYVALIGSPNAGKSTLLNQVLKNKLAITSDKPQTTRNRIAGVHTAPGYQAVLVDTPGIHTAWTELNKAMVDVALAALDEVDVVCWLADATELARRVQKGKPALGPDEEPIVAALQRAGRPVIFVANKIDVVQRPLLLPVIAQVAERVACVALVPISALTGDGVPELLEEVRRMLPVGPPLFPEDEWTQLSERFLVAEIVREKIFQLTEQEVPYASFVEVMRFDESARETDGRVEILCDVIVERPSQKGILIGKGGEMLKRIGTAARLEIVEMLGCRVHLELFVKVERDWSRTRSGLRRVGFTP